jgi:hypothetical protein
VPESWPEQNETSIGRARARSMSETFRSSSTCSSTKAANRPVKRAAVFLIGNLPFSNVRPNDVTTVVKPG